MANRTCSIEGCERGGLLRRGWCSPHYQRWLSHGDPMGGGIDRIKGDDEARFWSKIDKSGPLPAWRQHQRPPRAQARAVTAFEKYLRKRLLEAYVNISFYGTMDPDEVARKKAEGLNLRGIPKAEGLNPRGIPTLPEDEQ